MERGRKGVVLILFSLFHSVVPNADTGECTYNFQVWKPNQAVEARLAQLEWRLENVRMSARSELQASEDRLQRSLAQHYNLTLTTGFDLATLDQIVRQMQRDVNITSLLKDVRSIIGRQENELVSCSSNANDDIRNKLNKLQEATSSYPLFVDRTGSALRQLGAGLQELKEQWVDVTKTQMQTLTTETMSQIKEHASMKVDNQRITSAMSEIQADLLLLKTAQNEWLSGMDDLEARLNATAAQTLSRTTESLNRNMNTSKWEEKLSDLDERLGQLQGRVEAMEMRQERFRDSIMNVSRVDMPGTGIHAMAHDCHDWFQMGYRISGVYSIEPVGMNHAENVYCEMELGDVDNGYEGAGYGWTFVQRRIEGQLSFSRGWIDYTRGFGNPYTDHWLGNRLLHLISKQRSAGGTILRIDLWDWAGGRAYAQYERFGIGDERLNFRLTVGRYGGSAGDSLSLHDGMAFSTPDHDNDMDEQHCATDNQAGWWFRSCGSSNLNGRYHTSGWYSAAAASLPTRPPPAAGGDRRPSRGSAPPQLNGLVWFTWKNSYFFSLARSEIKIRPADVHGRLGD